MREIAITFFYLGHLPKIPGTWGSAGAAACYLVYAFVAQRQGVINSFGFEVALAIGVVIAAVIGVALGPWAVKRFDNKDPGPFVLDEVAGQWLALIAIPIGLSLPRLVIVTGTQFVLFRIFDIWKPTPARQLESLPHGWGIVADDLAVAVYTNLLGQAIFRYLWPLA